MRIISGSLKGRRLAAPPEGVVRPTPDRVREAVFNILGQRLDEMDFLDLYAGTGAMGLEAASRGARRVTLVERDRGACEVCLRNIASCGCGDRVELVQGDVLAVLEILDTRGTGYDVVFADPPYADPPGTLESLLGALARRRLAAPGASVVLQVRRGRPVPSHAGFEPREPRHYGITSILVLDRLTGTTPCELDGFSTED
jgi:16S rRNA (guanine(966)-N(2))-methyltransferase RsmD